MASQRLVVVAGRARACWEATQIGVSAARSRRRPDPPPPGLTPRFADRKVGRVKRDWLLLTLNVLAGLSVLGILTLLIDALP